MAGKVPNIQNKIADVFFRLSYKSFTIICFHENLFSFFLFVCLVFFFFFFFFLTDRTRTAVNVIYLLISVQFIFFHAL